MGPAMVTVAALAAAGMAGAATHTPVDPETLLSEDGFGACVPEEHLDDIWLLFASKSNGQRVPHVCMTGDCEDLPDIATWAAAQQYPDDVDLEREDVVARYASFVEDYCVAPDAADAPGSDATAEGPEGGGTTLDPAFDQGVTQLLNTSTFQPATVTVPPPSGPVFPAFAGRGSGSAPSGGGSGGGLNPDPDFLDDNGNGNGNGDDPDPPNGPTVIPLPPGFWLLLSALGLGGLLARARRAA